MKKTVTEYEGAEETVTKIACASCDERWDSRRVKGKNGVTTITLDLTLQYKSYHDEWKDSGQSAHRSRPYRMNAAAVEDYCSECWDGFKSGGLPLEVEETEYYVEEMEEDLYICDFCEHEMGTSPDHIITVNPRLVKVKSPTLFSEVRQESIIRERNERVANTVSSRLDFKYDEKLDCCDNCVQKLFDLESVVERSRGTLTNFILHLLHPVCQIFGALESM